VRRPTSVVHQEHGAVKLAPGRYRVRASGNTRRRPFGAWPTDRLFAISQ